MAGLSFLDALSRDAHSVAQNGAPFSSKEKAGRKKRVAFTFHSLGDVDGVASAFALKSHFKNSIVLPADSINSLSKKLLGRFNLKVDKPNDYDALVVLDCNSKILLGRFSNERAYAVIDHHESHTDPPSAQHAFINPAYSSTSEIVYEYLRSRKARIGKDIAFLLASGIILDSFNFTSSREKTFTYMGELLRIARTDYSEMLEFLEARPTFPQRMAVLKAFQNCTLADAGGYIVASSKVDSFESSAAESFLSLGADVAFVGYSGKDARISGRTTLHLAHRLDLAGMMASAGALMGGSGGGHPCAAGATGPRKEMLDKSLALCSRLALERLQE